MEPTGESAVTAPVELAKQPPVSAPVQPTGAQGGQCSVTSPVGPAVTTAVTAPVHC